MNHPEEKIRAALIEQFEYLKEGIALPELWRVDCPVDIRAVLWMDPRKLQAWFCGFTAARKLGMWWSYSMDRITLHGTRGKPPVVDRLFDLILWLNSLEEPPTVGKITRKNFSLLTTPTNPYSY